MIEFYYSIKDIIHRAQTETLLFTQNIEREDTGIAAIDEFATRFIASAIDMYIEKKRNI